MASWTSLPVGAAISRVSYTVSLEDIQEYEGRTKRRSLAPCRMRALDVVVVVILAVELSSLYFESSKCNWVS